tara:strand:+ start:1178 stop:1609 length:432 start_codon:yes stop_codon:yes gene_type:complete
MYKYFLRLVIQFAFCNYYLSQTTRHVSESNYRNEPDLSRVIDLTKPVNSIPGPLNVSKGSAGYIIPVNVPAGVNGHSPKISIGYNSSSGNGLLGIGFYLGAGGAITRTKGNYVFDSKVTPVNFTNSDKIALDGERLIIYSGNH